MVFYAAPDYELHPRNRAAPCVSLIGPTVANRKYDTPFSCPVTNRTKYSLPRLPMLRGPNNRPASSRVSIVALFLRAHNFLRVRGVPCPSPCVINNRTPLPGLAPYFTEVSRPLLGGHRGDNKFAGACSGHSPDINRKWRGVKPIKNRRFLAGGMLFVTPHSCVRQQLLPGPEQEPGRQRPGNHTHEDHVRSGRRSAHFSGFPIY